jgi:DNA-binding CsgD family transcriptional regulator
VFGAIQPRFTELRAQARPVVPAGKPHDHAPLQYSAYAVFTQETGQALRAAVSGAVPFKMAVREKYSRQTVAIPVIYQNGQPVFFPFGALAPANLVEREQMEGMTVSEIAKELKISVDAVRKRIETAGIQPITREALYNPSIVEELRKVRMGRPKKAAESDAAKPATAKRNTEKSEK